LTGKTVISRANDPQTNVDVAFQLMKQQSQQLANTPTSTPLSDPHDQSPYDEYLYTTPPRARKF